MTTIRPIADADVPPLAAGLAAPSAERSIPASGIATVSPSSGEGPRLRTSAAPSGR